MASFAVTMFTVTILPHVKASDGKFVTMGAMRSEREMFAHVSSALERDEMIWIAAAFISAGVMKIEAFRDRAFVELVHQAVDLVALAANNSHPITLLIQSTLPEEATGLHIDVQSGHVRDISGIG